MVKAHGNTAKALKLELKDQGFGCRFLQRLLNDSEEIPDDEILVPPLDLKLVRLSLCPFDRADAEALVEASKEGRLEEVETRLKKPQDPSASNAIGQTALHFAAESGHLECVRLLLEAGANCNLAGGQHGLRPLHCAVASGNVEVVRLLLEAGAACNQAYHSQAPLHIAALRGDVEVVRLLLAAGASRDLSFAASGTALLFATRNGHTEMVRLLLEAGITCDTDMSNVLLRLAADKGHDEICHLVEADQRKKRRKVTSK